MPLPPLVVKAQARAADIGFTKSCSDSFGSFLRSLAGSRDGRMLELGTGCGVGTAWILSGMRASGTLLTVEIDPGLHTEARRLLGDEAACEIRLADWREALRDGPFELIFVDVGPAKDAGAEEIVEALVPGGMVVLDDFTPGPTFQGQPDERWRLWMHHPVLVTSEILLSPTTAAILGSRR